MGHPVLAASVSALFLLVVSPAAAAPRCGLAGGKVIAHGKRVLVVQGQTRYGVTTYVACLRASKSRRHFRVEGRIRHLHVNGRYIAYEREDGCFDYCFRIASLDVSSGRRLVSYAAYQVNDSNPPRLRRLVLGANGDVAWVRDQSSRRELRKMDGDGEDVLDSGAAIDPASLRLVAQTLTWKDGVGSRSARLDTHPACSGRNTSTMERTDQARVYWSSERVYGCYLPTGRTTELGRSLLDDFEYYGGGHVHAAGHFATIDEGYGGREGADADLFVYDVSSGRVIHHWKEDDALVRTVVLAASGAVAWIGGAGRNAGEVRKSDADGEAVVLDSDTRYDAIDEHSLTLSGTKLTWTHSGITHSATLK